MFFDFLNALLSLDIGWFAWLVQANIIYLFAFMAICFFFWGENMKKAIVGVFLLSVVAWTWVDFEMLSGWVIFTGGFLMVYYITKIAILIFAEDVPALKNKLVIISEVQFITLIVIYNLFMR